MNSIQHLKYALEIEKTGSISKAAENLYMSQPQLSKAVRELEQDLGTILFNRSPHGVTLTENGHYFVEYARKILCQIDEMETRFHHTDTVKRRFNVVVPRASYVSYAFTSLLKELNPNREWDISYYETDSLKAINNIADGVSNLGIIRFPSIYEGYFKDILTQRDLVADEIWEFSYLALLSKEHPLARQQTVTVSQLEAYPEIVHGDLTLPTITLGNHITKTEALPSAKRIAVYERGSQFELLMRIPTTYMWVSPMPQDVLDCFQLVQKRCDTEQNRQKDLLVFRRGYQLSDEDMIFMEKITDAVKLVRGLLD